LLFNGLRKRPQLTRSV